MKNCYRNLIACILVLVVPLWPGAAQGGKFKRDDPLWQDSDRVSIPKPTVMPLSKPVDLFQKTFSRPKAGVRPAVNVNTLGEVPDSSWFTNRMSQRTMTIHELVLGPNQGEGPDMSKPWTIVAAKTAGVTPGFRIRDARGDYYLIKFDPLYWPQMATSAEIIGTKFFYAFGYHTPENYLVHWRPEYNIEPGKEVVWYTGQVGSLNKAYVKRVLNRVPRRPDGTIQVVASKFLPGKYVGEFDYQGTRSDDPNDIFPHQDRRDLRGLRVFSSWLNHNDSDSVNTFDSYVTDPDGRSYVRHYLIDFGTVMGSGATLPHARRVGNEYYIEFKPSLKAAATLGIWDRPWRHVEYVEYPAVGRFESAYFQPQNWKPDYPNPAFDSMQPEDALWAVRTVMRFSDNAVRAVVKTGKFDDPRAEDYVLRVLLERRDKIIRYYLAQINPLEGFQTTTASAGERNLEFVNLGVQAGLASGCMCEYSWHRYDNQTGTITALGAPASTPSLKIRVPADSAEFLMVRISSNCPAQPKWKSAVEVYLRNGSSPSVVGIERAGPGK
jgi:hypothetical protein